MNYRAFRLAAAAAVVIGMLLFMAPAAGAGVVVPTQHNDNFRTGANLAETVLAPASVTRLGMQRVDRAVDGVMNTQILYAHGVSAGGRERNIAYVTTSANSVYAFDADDRTNGLQSGILWRRTLSNPGTVQNTFARGISATPLLEHADGKGTIDVLYSTPDPYPSTPLALTPTL